MTKKTTKATKSPAPATKATKETKPAAKSAAKSTSTKASAKQTASATSAIVAAITRAAAPAMLNASAASPIKAVATTPAATTITAKIDVGFGNALYIRGEGTGLSWDEGRAMTNVGRDLWQVELGESARPLVFKFLINDVTWSTGADYTLAPGASQTFAPEF